MKYEALVGRIQARIEVLKAQRDGDFSERKACLEAGLKVDAIRLIRKGHSPKTDTIHRLAKALELHPWILFEVAYGDASSAPLFDTDPPVFFTSADAKPLGQSKVIELFEPETERFRDLRRLIRAALVFTSQISERPLSDGIIDRHTTLVLLAFIALGTMGSEDEIDFGRVYATLDAIKAGTLRN